MQPKDTRKPRIRTKERNRKKPSRRLYLQWKTTRGSILPRLLTLLLDKHYTVNVHCQPDHVAFEGMYELVRFTRIVVPRDHFKVYQVGNSFHWILMKEHGKIFTLSKGDRSLSFRAIYTSMTRFQNSRVSMEYSIKYHLAESEAEIKGDFAIQTCSADLEQVACYQTQPMDISLMAIKNAALQLGTFDETLILGTTKNTPWLSLGNNCGQIKIKLETPSGDTTTVKVRCNRITRALEYASRDSAISITMEIDKPLKITIKQSNITVDIYLASINK